MQVSRNSVWRRVLLTAVATATIAGTASAQRDRTRISSLERTSFELDENGRSNPGFDFRGGTSPQSIQDIDVSKVDQRALINLLKDAVSETERLYRALQRDAQQSRELQSSLSEVRKLRTGASYIIQDLEDGRRLQTLLPVVRELSSDWHLLSHQLGRAPRISRASLEIVNRIDGQARRMEQMFRLDPQLDRRALVSELARMHSVSDSLVRELEYDPRVQGLNNNLIYDARKMSQQLQQIEGMVLDQDTYERIVDEYGRFKRMWAVLLRDLRPLDNRYIERQIGDIVSSDGRVHDLLWLEKTANREQLQQLANSLIRKVDEFFNRTPLRLVVNLQNVDSILAKAGDFYGTVHHFKDTVESTDEAEDLLESYGYVERYGHDFVDAFSALKSEAGRVVLKEIDDGIASLRAELNISGTVDSVDVTKLVTSAARLENLADHLRIDVRHWLDRDRKAWRQDALDSMDRFVQRSSRMHRLIQSRPNLAQLRDESKALNASWSELYRFLAQCRTEDRTHIEFLQNDVNSALYDLEAPLRQ